MSAEGTRRAIFAAFFANLGVALSKFAAFLITGSASMLAEAIHSVADTGNQGLLFLGGKRARKAPTAEHPFGYGTERYFWAFVVALVLFTLGGLFAMYEGVEKLITPHELASPIWAFAVLFIAIALEGWSLRTARREATPSRGKRTWWAFIRTTKSPELPVVLLEDSGALVGLLFALVGISLAEITGNSRWDALGSIGIGLLLCVIAVVLAIEMKSLLIGEAVAPQVDEEIRTAILDGPEVSRIIHLRTQHLGPDDVLLTAKLEFTCATIPELARAIDTAEARVRAAAPAVRLIFFEPDLYDAARASATDTEPEEAPMADTAEAIDRFNAAFNDHDVDAVMAAMTDDCVFENTSPPNGQRYEGQEQVRAAWEEFFAASPDARFDGEDVIVAGDRCTVQWVYTWTNDDGTPSSLRGVDVLRVRDGKVSEKFAYVKG
ncbi:MAG TPA: cation diffusion facilitator family transporter [Acidimicrobiia bacterium]